MSMKFIKDLVNNKYNEINNMQNKADEADEADKAKNIEKFIYDCLDKYDKNKVMYFIKTLFDIKIEYIEENLENLENIDNLDNVYKKENTQVKVCRNDTEFKKAVNELYKTCIICDIGDCHKSAYEVAHIWDFAKCDTPEQKYDVNNGILLCANMHKYFDSKCGLLKFEPISHIDDNNDNDNDNDNDNNNYNNYNNTVICKVVFCESISDSSYYKKYNGKQIKFNKQNIMYLEKKNLGNLANIENREKREKIENTENSETIQNQEVIL